MNITRYLGAILLLGSMAQGASAANELTILSSDLIANSAKVEMSGNSNSLFVLQDHFGGLEPNSLEISIVGDRNGGPAGSLFDNRMLASELTPGTLRQSGFGNAMTIEVNGSENLFAAAQIGSGNVLTGFMQGEGNQTAILQVGTGNVVGFSQSGYANVLSVVQNSW